MASQYQTYQDIVNSGQTLNPSQQTEYEKMKAADPFEQAKKASSPESMVATAQKLRQFNIESNQPAISSLQEQIPEVEQKFAAEQTRLGGEKEPLKQRYQSIIDELTRREGVDITATQRRTGQEFGYRGIPASSTLYLDELQRAESPIRQAYGGQIKDVGFERETGLRGIDQLISNLAGQSTEAKRTIQNAIGQLQSGDPASAIQGAMSILQLQQQQQQFMQQQALAERELTEYKIPSLAKTEDTDISKNFTSVGEGSALFNLLTGQEVFKNPKTYKSAVGAGNLPDLNSIFG